MVELARRHWRTALASLSFGAALLGAAVLLWPRPTPPLVVLTPTARPSPSPPPTLVVHVVGAVAAPGVYQLLSGARVEDAVALAGGMAPEADPSSLNLAARLVDGQQVQVRARNATVQASSTANERGDGKLRLNHASAAELDTLPGIGPVLAQRIVERRLQLGLYTSLDQLRDEKLVPGPTYERIKDLLTLD